LVLRITRRAQVYPDLSAASAALAEEVFRRAEGAVAARGRFSCVISGGRTPLELYAILGDRYGRDLPWARTEVFFADERCVPPGHPDSNFGTEWKAFLSRVPVPRHRIHRMRGELRPRSEAASRYARQVGAVDPGDPPGEPRFDLVLLGIGPDGHTASLFPGQSAVRERRRPVVAVRRGGLPPHVPRITMTPPALSSAREVCFLVAGADKARAVSGIFRSGPDGTLRLPASRIRPPGPSLWFLDRAAAAGLSPATASGAAP
jgi:6-phosphogluconolactonase